MNIYIMSKVALAIAAMIAASSPAASLTLRDYGDECGYSKKVEFTPPKPCREKRGWDPECWLPSYPPKPCPNRCRSDWDPWPTCPEPPIYHPL
jgi:hypothetical protein